MNRYVRYIKQKNIYIKSLSRFCSPALGKIKRGGNKWGPLNNAMGASDRRMLREAQGMWGALTLKS